MAPPKIKGVIFRVSESQRVKLPIPETPEPQPEVDEALKGRLEQLYTDGLSAFWLEDWEEAHRCFQAIVDVRPGYHDAAAKLEEAKRQAKLATLYHQAQAAQEAKDWGGARSALEELVAEAPDFEDAADVLEAVRKQKRMADLYAEAQQLSQAQQWQAVLNVFAQIQTIEPDYPDPENLLALRRSGGRSAETPGRAKRSLQPRRPGDERRTLGAGPLPDRHASGSVVWPDRAHNK